MTLAIRPALKREIDAIRDLERASSRRFLGVMDALAVDDPTPADVLARRLGADGLLAATIDGELAAFVMFRPLEDSHYIEQIDVNPRFQGRRIGAALIDAVAERAAAAGLARLTLSTFRDIPWNAPYYRRLGFLDIPDAALSDALRAVRREHVARGLDEGARLFMQRPI
ncbi:GNAT family N-acetyltransferase [Caulobacter segnis]|uniref:GNAT family N-acetyltransferase n=1 Tax=Caulobacter segnis TaxID=88688 RepID=UPI00285B661B|nr:GNAT family N-acetyltransferase [Caulobacter segnis]MDR6627509.1 GNAT superfamily N-acetyltransferase [Caulobacter segnis]